MRSRPIDAWRRFWFTPASLVDLGVSRVVLALILLWLFGRTRYLGLAWASTRLYRPVGILYWLGVGKPEASTVLWLAQAASALLIAIALGLGTRAALWLFLAIFTVLETGTYSFGKISHGTIPLYWAVVFFALAPCDRAATLPRLWKRLRGQVPPAGTSPYARWPLELLYVQIATFYFAAGLSKLRDGGLGWADGYTLQFHLLQKNTPAGVWAAQHVGLDMALSTLVLAFELGFPLSIFWRRLRPVFLAGGVLFHLGTTVLMDVTFWPVVATYALFVPWERVLRSLRRGPPATTST